MLQPRTRFNLRLKSLFWASAVLTVNIALLSRPFSIHLRRLLPLNLSSLPSHWTDPQAIEGAQWPMPSLGLTAGNKAFLYAGFGADASKTEEEWKLRAVAPNHPTLGASFPQCLTYPERYARYDRPLPSWLWRPRKLSKVAFNVRCISSRISHPVPPDFAAHLRALITEAEVGMGMDTYIVVDMKGEDLPVEDWLETVPEEFRSRVLPFEWSNIQESYPEDTLTWIWEDNHATASWFLQHPVGSRYNFLWQVERDVRMVGGSWVQWFSKLNATAEQSSPTAFPDLVTFQGIWPGRYDSRKDKCLKFIEPENLKKAWVSIWGVSRRMSDVMQQSLFAGNTCYVELFVPSISTQANLTIFSPAIPTFGSAHTNLDTFHCCGNASQVFYQQWKDDADLCRPGPLLLHKYKSEWERDRSHSYRSA